MSFLYFGMLAGLTSLALPVILHLIARQKFPVMDFPTVRLLMGEHRTNTIAMRLVDKWQLLLRLLVLLLLVLAMSRLFVSWHSKRQAAHNTVIVIDGSASMMQLVDKPGGKGKITLFDLAKERAADILNGVDSPSRSSVVIAGDATTIAAPLEPGHEHAKASLEGAKAYDACGSGLVEAVAHACDLLSDRREASSQIIVLTNLRQSSLEYRSQRDLQRIEEIRGQQREKLQIVFVDLAAAATENVGITNASIRGRKVMAGADAHVISTIFNTGTKEQKTKVSASVGNPDTVSKIVTITPGSRAVVDLTSPVNRAMRTFARVSIDGDSFPADDQFSVPLPVVDSRRVLIVNGQGQAAGAGAEPAIGALQGSTPPDAKKTSHEPEIDGATILKFVLNPGRELGGTSNSGIDPAMVTPEAVAVQPLSKYEIVVLYDVSSLPEQVMADLATFVSEGRSLLIICSGKTSAVQFNRSLAAETKEHPALAPAELESNEIDSKTPLELSLKDNTHPILAAFADPRHGDLSVVHFEKIRALRPTPLVDGTSIILQTPAQQPLALEKALGRGRVVMFTFGFELDRGNIARTRVFPPFMWRVVDYLTGQLRSLPPDQLVARTPAALDVSETEFNEAIPAVGESPSVTQQRPRLELKRVAGDAAPSKVQPATSPAAYSLNVGSVDAAPILLKPSSDRTVMIDGLAPGRYRLEMVYPDEKGVVLKYFRAITVQSDPRAGDMARFDANDLARQFPPLAAIPRTPLAGFWPARMIKLPAKPAVPAPLIASAVPQQLIVNGGEFWKVFVFCLFLAYTAEAILGFLATARRERDRAPGMGVPA